MTCKRNLTESKINKGFFLIKNYLTVEENNVKWQEPKFPTECYFLTVQAHHLSILPITRKYTRRLRAIRDLTRMCDEMEKAEVAWKNTPIASRNKELLARWKSQVKVRKFLSFFVYFNKSSWYLFEMRSVVKVCILKVFMFVLMKF